MKILYIWGDDDYGALMFEQSKYTVEEVAKLCEEKPKNRDAQVGHSIETIGEKAIDISYTEKYYYEFKAELIEFGDIDPEFIDFIRDKFQDYDESKHHEFFIVKG